MTPFFVLGNPRSGTSLLRLMLNSHPQITVPPECGFALWLAERFAGRPVNADLYRDYAEAVLQTRKFETWGLGFDLLYDTLCREQPADYPSLASCVYLAYARLQGKTPTRVGDKNNYYVDHLDALAQWFPAAPWVFIVRDGRDVACSYQALADNPTDSAYKPQLPVAIADIARQWQCHADAFRRWQSRGLLVRYEDLLTAPQPTLVRICQTLDLRFDAAMLDYTAHHDEPAALMDWKAKTLSAPDSSNIGKYRQLLSAADCQAFEAIAGSGLACFGYR